MSDYRPLISILKLPTSFFKSPMSVLIGSSPVESVSTIVFLIVSFSAPLANFLYLTIYVPSHASKLVARKVIIATNTLIQSADVIN